MATWVVFDANGTLFDLRAAAPAVGGEVVLDELKRLPPFTYAQEAVAAARGRAAILTNGGSATTRGLVDGAGLPIETILSCEEVRAYKPTPPPYELARRRLDEVVLVAAHAWDVAAARAAGVRAVWVDQSEQRWPLPGVEPGERASSLVDAVTLALG